MANNYKVGDIIYVIFYNQSYRNKHIQYNCGIVFHTAECTIVNISKKQEYYLRLNNEKEKEWNYYIDNNSINPVLFKTKDDAEEKVKELTEMFIKNVV